jgi:hypothetical protein
MRKFDAHRYLPALLRNTMIVSTPWYLSGGLTVSDCVAAYQPKEASSEESSYINLVNPGTYNAAPGVAPTWNSGGWLFNGTTQYLKTGVKPNGNYSMIARVSSSASNSFAFTAGATNESDYFVMGTQAYYPRTCFNWGNSNWKIFGTACNGVVALTPESGGTIYTASGSYSAGATWSGGALDFDIWIGGCDDWNTLYGAWGGYVQAFAIYNISLSESQVNAITTALNILFADPS